MRKALRVMETTPVKPEWGEPCNGCGGCCVAEVCAIGKRIYGEAAEGPCPALVLKDDRFWCGVVLKAEELAPAAGVALRLMLGVGTFCDSEFHSETEGEVMGATVKVDPRTVCNLTSGDAAKQLGYNQRHVQNLIAAGKLGESVTAGRIHLISQAGIDAYKQSLAGQEKRGPKRS